MSTKRLIKELDAHARDPSPALLKLEPLDDDLHNLTAVLKGPDGTAYENGHFTLTLLIPPTYPTSPPQISFQTPCCHPNIHFQTGEICLDLLKSAWTPAYGVVSALEAVQQLLAAGGVGADSPLNLEVARLYREADVVGAEGMVRFFTRVYAGVA